jgi:hypothetical protein
VDDLGVDDGVPICTSFPLKEILAVEDGEDSV